jgi:hypothetical protein
MLFSLEFRLSYNIRRLSLCDHVLHFELGEIVVVLILLFSHWMFDALDVRQELNILSRGYLYWVHLPNELIISLLLLSFLPQHF